MLILDSTCIGLLKNKNITEVDKKAKKLLSDVGIAEELYNKNISNISGGEAQRVAIVRSVINSPKILFADEPTGALNSKSGKQVLDLLTSLNRNGHCVVLVTHDIHAGLRGNRILYIKDGVIYGECTLGEYQEGSVGERMKILEAFLERMGW